MTTMRALILYSVLLPAIFQARFCAAEDDVARNLERLRSSRFEEREAATLSLIEAGERGVEAAKRAAGDEELEVRVRGMRVLQGIAIAPEETGARAAEEALLEFTKSSDIAVSKLATASLRSVKKYRREEQQKLIARLRTLGGVALLNESGEVQRIDFEGEYITDEGLEAQRTASVRFKMAQGFFDRAEFASKYIVRTRVTDNDLEILRKFPALTYLNLQRTEATDAGLVHLKSLRKLEHLVLSPRTTDEGLAHLAHLKQLKSICLAQTQVTGVGFAQQEDLSHLEEIDLTNSQASDAGLEKICELAGLLTLNLGNSKVTDEGLPHLSRLGKLQRLTLHRTGITDAGLEHLLKLEDLRSLMLDGTKVTDQGIGQLASLKHLDAISFTEPLVTKEGVEKLRGQMPKASIHLWPATTKR